MNGEFKAEVTIDIKAPAGEVWKGLTDPAIIKQYFFGTDAQSDWEEGSPLIFTGEWEGKEYVDKGTILKNDPGKLLKYNYLSSFSGLEDTPENYAEITYALSEYPGGTRLLIIQDGIDSKERRDHSMENWGSVMNGLKDILEKR